MRKLLMIGCILLLAFALLASVALATTAPSSPRAPDDSMAATATTPIVVTTAYTTKAPTTIPAEQWRNLPLLTFQVALYADSGKHPTSEELGATPVDLNVAKTGTKIAPAGNDGQNPIVQIDQLVESQCC